jgi:hypothetical protein
MTTLKIVFQNRIEERKTEKSNLRPKSPLGSISLFCSIPLNAAIRLEEIRMGRKCFQKIKNIIIIERKK